VAERFEAGVVRGEGTAHGVNHLAGELHWGREGFRVSAENVSKVDWEKKRGDSRAREGKEWIGKVSARIASMRKETRRDDEKEERGIPWKK
jgi:hypothetical protein